MKAPDDYSLISGGLAGILAASVFGGPVGAAIGLGTGLLSQRMHRNELDILADDYEAVHSYGSSIQDQVKTTSSYLDRLDASGYDSSADREQLGSISEEAARAQHLSQHYDAGIRQAGLQQLTNTGAKFDALYGDINARTKDLADKQYAIENEQRLHYQNEFESTQNQVRELTANANQARMLLKGDPSVSKVETKSALMHLLGMTTREADQDAASFSIGLLGTAYQKQLDDFSPSYSDAVKIIESVEQTKLKAASDYLGQLVQTAEHQGYAFAQNTDGKVTVKTINSVIQQFRAGAPFQTPGATPGKPAEPGTKFDPTQLPSDAENLGGAVVGGIKDSTTALGDFLHGAGIPRLDNDIKEGVSGGLESLSKQAQAAKEIYLNFISRNKKRKRPTNK
jgi:hypothetical protein